MITGIIGKKIGMTQLFDADGTVWPGTVIKAGPCVVVQAKSTTTDGYEAVQIGLVEDRPARVTKPLAGHYKKAGVPPTRVRRELPVAAGSEALKPGDQVLASMFADGDRVDVIGVGSGKGFQGVMKRHNFGGGAASHGSMFHRAPGSIGASSYPVTGHQGNARAGSDGRQARDGAQPAGGARGSGEPPDRGARGGAGRGRRLRRGAPGHRGQGVEGPAGGEAQGEEVAPAAVRARPFGRLRGALSEVAG